MPNIFRFLPKNKIRSAKEFDVVFKQGKRVFGQYFILHYLRNDRSTARLGILISKKKCRLAVHRNQLRRLIREKFRLNQQALTGVDLVVVLKSRIEKGADQELCQCLEKQFLMLIEQCGGSSRV